MEMTMPLATGEGLGASGWESDGESGLLGSTFGTVEAILGGSARAARDNPVVAAAVAAALIGAIVGSRLAARSRRPTPVERLSRAGRKAAGIDIDLAKASSIPDLLPPLMRLLSNPLVQSYLRRAITNMISGKLAGR
jgi:hypothetical protein